MAVAKGWPRALFIVEQPKIKENPNPFRKRQLTFFKSMSHITGESGPLSLVGRARYGYCLATRNAD